MTDFSTIDITEAKKLLSQKKITATELTEFFIKQIEEKKGLNCFITNTFDIALKMAKESDEKIQKGLKPFKAL